MMDVSIQKPLYLLLLILIFGVLLVGIYFLRWRKNTVKNFADDRFLKYLGISEGKTFSWKLIPIFLGGMCMVLAMSGFVGGAEKMKVKQRVSSVVYLLDVSNSMNAEDVAPNRLEVAKDIILKSLQKSPDDRVGIVVFAGNAFSLMPLTTDHEAAEVYLKGLQTSVIKVQGTDFLMPVQIAAEKLKNVVGGKQIVIVSDGEDNEGKAGDAIKTADSEEIKIFTVGVGLEEGAPIPEYSFGQLMGYKTDREGNSVVTKRQTEALKDMADATGGSYIDGNQVDTAVSELQKLLHSHKTGTEVMIDSKNAKHYFPYFLGAALFFFSLVYLLNRKKDFNL